MRTSVSGTNSSSMFYLKKKGLRKLKHYKQTKFNGDKGY